jgi:outer membrane protein OmpA-like peptidoglycan-associated protein
MFRHDVCQVAACISCFERIKNRIGCLTDLGFRATIVAAVQGSETMPSVTAGISGRGLAVLAAAAIWSSGTAGLHAQEDIVWTKEQIVERLVRVEEEPLTRSALRGIRVGETSGTVAASAPSGWIGDLRVPFAFDSAEITPEARQTLDALGEALTDERLSTDRFEIAGHTDGIGDEGYNASLSQRRAQAVVGYLSSHFGIESERLVGRGYGEGDLAYPDDPDAPGNRRVEILNLQ